MAFNFNFFKKQREEFGNTVYSVYQPIVDIATGDVIGYEALSRSEKEMPAEMFRRSYEKGTVIPFDFHCLESAIKVLPELQPGQYLFLNIEPLTLERAFSKGKEGEEFLKGLKAYTDKVVFELTEGVKKSVHATCEGTLLATERGGQGFGYDPLFVKHDYSKTFAELDEEMKNRISHRAQALQRAVQEWGAILAACRT